MTSQEHTLQFITRDESAVSDSVKLRLVFTERTVQRLKQQNQNQKAKVQALTKQLAQITHEKRKLKDTFDQQRRQVKRLEKQMEIRTNRYENIMNDNISSRQREMLQEKLRHSEDTINFILHEKDLAMKANHSLLVEIQQKDKQKINLAKELELLSMQNQQNFNNASQLKRMFEEKVKIVEEQNCELKKQIQSLILQVKLFENKQKINSLLMYQKHIQQPLFKEKHKRNITSMTNTSQSGKMQCCCDQLFEKIYEKQELIELYKQKNARMNEQLKINKKRIVTLQNLICNK